MERKVGLFKALADPIRLRLAALMARNGETCVCELAHAVDEPHFKVSRHLTIMRMAGMITVRREGTWAFYTLASPHDEFDSALHKCLEHHLYNDAVTNKDFTRLKEFKCNQEQKK